MKKTKLLLALIAVISLMLVFAVGASAVMLGDVDNNAKIQAADARLTLRASVSLKGDKDKDGNVLDFTNTSSREYIAANVDGKAGISSADARLILRASVGLETFGHTHTYGGWITEKNEKGFTTGRHYRVCSCGEKEYADCTYGTPVEKSPATCTSSNTMQKTCTLCGAVKVFGGSVAALGHIKEYSIKDVAPTCTTKGTSTYYCSRCKKNVTETVKALGHDFTSTEITDSTTLIESATCTTDARYYYACSRCKVSAKGIDEKKTYTAEGTKLGHDYKVANCVFDDSVRGLICNRCKYKDTSPEGYNQLVNAIKSPKYINSINSELEKYSHTVTVISKSKMTSTCDNIDGFGAFNLTIKSLYKDEMSGDDISYLVCRRNRYIGNIIPLANTTTSSSTPVSSIENGDATITVETVSGLAANALLADFGNIDENNNVTNTITVGKTDYDIADLKAKAVSGDLLKVTATANNETFFGANGVSKLAATEKSALQKLTGYDIRLDAAEFGENYTLTQVDSEEDVYSMKMDMKLKEITSGATVTYYFEASTLKPVAARYDINVNMSQDVAMNIEIFGSDALSVSGTMDPAVDTVTSIVYLFSDFYG